ncbi:hypothetical protein CI610_02859 [invertebrate metagenome]|uniref:Uncharacterized protein n=1 Tax=invertebrate metagenome TaxID=1711999 RepID=A0A2H9T4S4_9ZZZZ
MLLIDISHFEVDLVHSTETETSNTGVISKKCFINIVLCKVRIHSGRTTGIYHR